MATKSAPCGARKCLPFGAVTMNDPSGSQCTGVYPFEGSFGAERRKFNASPPAPGHGDFFAVMVTSDVGSWELDVSSVTVISGGGGGGGGGSGVPVISTQDTSSSGEQSSAPVGSIPLNGSLCAYAYRLWSLVFPLGSLCMNRPMAALYIRAL